MQPSQLDLQDKFDRTSEFVRAHLIPADDRRLRRTGIIIILCIFVGLGAWTALAPLSSAALAPGVITVETYRKTVQHLEGGIVKTLLVKDGESVSKDQVLVTLEDTQPRAQLEVLRGQYFISLAREARLIAQHEALKAVQYPTDLLNNREDERVGDAIRVQDQTFKARKSALEGEISLYQTQISQLKSKADGLRAQQQSRGRLVASYQAELQDFRALLAEGYAEKQKVREFERNLAEAEGQRGEIFSEIATTELQISEAKVKIIQITNEFQREVAKELSEVQSDLFALREKLQSLEDMVARTTVKAPDAGMVLGLAVHTLGAVLRPGEKILDIVPQNEKLIVEARVSPLDIDRVHAGQMSEIRFSAFKSRDVSKVEGTLVSVSADRLIDEADENKSSYYLARVEIPSTSVQELARSNLYLVPGMPAEVLINTGERTLLRYLLDPLANSFARAFIED
jgi:epimerase transport system membrane fusion protein